MRQPLPPLRPALGAPAPGRSCHAVGLLALLALAGCGQETSAGASDTGVSLPSDTSAGSDGGGAGGADAGQAADGAGDADGSGQDAGTPGLDGQGGDGTRSPGCTTDKDCADTDPCTVDSCAQGQCSHATAADGAGCDDGDKCTSGDTCAKGVCTPGPATDCTPSTSCATGACDPAKGCVFAEKTGPCDDGSACTTDDTCTNAFCKGAPLNCDDGNACSDDSCDPVKGCVHTATANDVPCGGTKVCAAGSCVSAGTLYAHTSSALYQLDLKTKAFTLVANFTFDKSGGSVTDIALDRSSSLFAVTFGDLFTCKTTNAKCTWLMKLPTSFNGLTFVHKGTIYPAQDALIGVANDGGWYHVDYQATPPKLKKLGSYGSGYTSSGDAFSVLGIGTYATVKKSGVGGDVLVRVDPKTGKVLQDLGGIGASNLWGFAWWDGVFYGFASNGAVWDIDVKTGKGKQLSGFTIPKAAWWGAGVSTEAGP